MTDITSEEYQQEIKTRPRQRGKWLRSDVPKYGWHCVRMVDRDGDLSLSGPWCWPICARVLRSGLPTKLRDTSIAKPRCSSLKLSPAGRSCSMLERLSREISNSTAPGHDGAQHVLLRDYETRGVLALNKVGAHRYAADSRTTVLCCAYAVDNEPVKLWTPGDAIPPEFYEAANNPNWIAVAHNAHFEMAIEQHILGPRFGWPLIPLARQRCTMAMALALSLPAKLDAVARALELRHQKDAVGHRLMLMMAKPRKPHKDEDPNQLYWFEDQDRLGRLYEYSQADAESERELYGRLPPLSPSEQALWILDATINQRGFLHRSQPGGSCTQDRASRWAGD